MNIRIFLQKLKEIIANHNDAQINSEDAEKIIKKLTNEYFKKKKQKNDSTKLPS